MLTEAQVRSVRPREKRYKLADSEGLYLDVRTNGGKSWLVRIEKGGKRTWRSIGTYPVMTLLEAREKAIQIKRGILGLDSPEKPFISFRQAAEEFSPHLELTNNSIQSIKMLHRTLEIHVYPFIGAKEVCEIRPGDMLQIIERLELMGKRPTARRVHQLCGRIFRYAILKDYCLADPCYALKGHVLAPQVKHRACITNPTELGYLMRGIEAYDKFVVKQAMKLAAYSFCRPNEVRLAEWKEFDLKAGTWTIPANKMKMKREHIVPITRQIREILEAMRPVSLHLPHVFCGTMNPEQPIPKSAILYGVRALGYTSEQMTAHGFRAMASTILNENKTEQGFDSDWIELQLAHVSKDQVRSAYNRAQYWEGRCRMVQWYDDYLDGLRDEGCQ